MRDAKALAAHRVDVAPFELVGRCERHRVHEDVEAIPARGETVEECVDLCVLGDVERQREIAAELRRHFFDARLEFLGLVAERQRRTFAMHRGSNSPRNRTVARETYDHSPLAGQESHQPLCSSTLMNITRRWPGCKYC